MRKRVAVLILQRNLPHATEAMVETLRPSNDETCDFFGIESGSDPDKVSKHCSFHADWPEAIEKGLHYPRGMNFGLSELHKTVGPYEHYFMCMGDAKFDPEACSLQPLLDLMDEHPKAGIVSPYSAQWGTDVPARDLCLHYLFPHVAWLVRHSFLERVIDTTEPQHMSYFYDGSNFRGYDVDEECIWKCYQHGYFAAVTDRVRFFEDHALMSDNADAIKTERVEQHRKLMFEEGLAWMERKYGFRGKQEMRNAVYKAMYDFLFSNQAYVPFAVRQH